MPTHNRFFCALPSSLLCCVLAAGAFASSSYAQTALFSPARLESHETPEWQNVQAHLPNRATATPAALETAGDVLRARRFHEDAIDLYQAAIARGGDEAHFLNRIGISYLEIHQVDIARACFRRVLKLKPRDSDAWNNLGATEHVAGNYIAAVGDYRQSVKLNKKNAIFHSNLGTALFETKDFEGASRQFEVAAHLDPNVFHRDGSGGVQARVSSTTDRGRFCFTMAQIAMRQNDVENTLSWLKKASEAGFDIGYEMSQVREFVALRHDERVQILIQNAKALRSTRLASAAPAPALPPDPKAH